MVGRTQRGLFSQLFFCQAPLDLVDPSCHLTWGHSPLPTPPIPASPLLIRLVGVREPCGPVLVFI